MLQFRHASRASQGARSYQEDACAVWPGESALAPRAPAREGMELVAVLADGMGGHAAGDVASSTICGMFLEQLALSEGPARKALPEALTAANEAIRRKVEANRSLEGMGATLVGVVFDRGGGADWISVGDSPLYLHRRGDMVRLNEDHSLAPLIDQLVADGKLDAEEARSDPRRHYLRSAVTGDEIELVDASDAPLRLEAQDIILVASDGLLSLEDEEICRIITAYRADGVEVVAEALLRAVDAAGIAHQDNTTVVVIEAVRGG